jgi:hypothetical protein
VALVRGLGCTVRAPAHASPGDLKGTSTGPRSSASFCDRSMEFRLHPGLADDRKHVIGTPTGVGISINVLSLADVDRSARRGAPSGRGYWHSLYSQSHLLTYLLTNSRKTFTTSYNSETR